MDQDFLNEDDSFYYLIQNNAGESLPFGFGSLENGNTLAFEGDSNIEFINVSVFKYVANQNRINAITYLNISTEKTINLAPNASSTSGSPVQVQIINRPSQLDEFIFSANNRFTPGSLSILPPDENTSFGIGGYDQLQTSFVTIEDVDSSIPQYQILNLSDDNVNIIDYNDNLEMETSHEISSTISDVQLTIELKGYQTSDFENPEGNHVLYNNFRPSLVQNNFSIYSLNSFFSDYRLDVLAEKNNIKYTQTTNGSIPSTFTPIDPLISINQSSFSNYEIVADNSYSTTNSHWTLKDENNASDLLQWSIYSSNNQSSFLELSNLPSNLPPELEALNSIEELNLNFVRAINIPGQDYDTSINILFQSDDLNLLPEISTKTLLAQ